MLDKFSLRSPVAWLAILGSALILLLSSLPESGKARLLVQQPQTPRIQLAILLDTSSSMSGLINQSRNQLWQMVNEFARARQNGKTPVLEVAVYEYGHSRLPAQSGFIRQVTGLTSELDQVSEALFSLTTAGGDEYCGMVIQRAVNDLQWSNNKNDIRAIFIAGNEPFTQGPVNYHHAIQSARDKGIVVNTIHAGDFQTGANTGWQHGAQLAGGDYMHIDHNHVVAHIVAPQDKRLAELNAQLNKTYVPYGASGAKKLERQARQDKRNQQESIALLAERVKSKVSSLYSNEEWDLVDAVESGNINLKEIDTDKLPAPMQAMAPEQRQDYIQENAEQRRNIRQEIQALTEARDKYIAEKRRESAEKSVNTVNDALISAIHRQGKSRNFVF